MTQRLLKEDVKINEDDLNESMMNQAELYGAYALHHFNLLVASQKAKLHLEQTEAELNKETVTIEIT